ncbi:MAG TPA: DUF2917 domain-containing protein [Burkholderiales bacterium]|nr:DUF2917 domain-containing protein [Burkholderiales bacterium]
MTLELRQGAVRLGRGQTLRVHGGAGSTLCAQAGTLWITEENGRDDVVLRAGQCFRLTAGGLALVQAFDDASLQVN